MKLFGQNKYFTCISCLPIRCRSFLKSWELTVHSQECAVEPLQGHCASTATSTLKFSLNLITELLFPRGLILLVYGLLLSNSKTWWYLGMHRDMNLIYRGFLSTTLKQQHLFPAIRKTGPLRDSRLVLRILPSRPWSTLLESNLKQWTVLMMIFLLKIIMIKFNVP